VQRLLSYLEMFSLLFFVDWLVESAGAWGERDREGAGLEWLVESWCVTLFFIFHFSLIIRASSCRRLVSCHKFITGADSLVCGVSFVSSSSRSIEVEVIAYPFTILWEVKTRPQLVNYSPLFFFRFFRFFLLREATFRRLTPTRDATFSSMMLLLYVQT